MSTAQKIYTAAQNAVLQVLVDGGWLHGDTRRAMLFDADGHMLKNIRSTTLMPMYRDGLLDWDGQNLRLSRKGREAVA